jgi:hypothetical protein
MESELRTRPPASDKAGLEGRHADGHVVATPVEAPVAPIESGAADEDDEDDVDAEPGARFADSETEEHIEIVMTETAPVAPADESDSALEPSDVDGTETTPDPEPSTDDESSITDDRTAQAVRRSFYSRRSAKLPRIGVEAGRSAMAAAAGLRTGVTSHETKDESDPDRSQEFETV